MNAKRLVRIALFLVLTVIGGFIKIPVGAICFTMQTVFVLSSGIFLGGKDGAMTQISYLILGLIGVPMFTNGGGIFYFMQVSFGYLLAFPITALLSGILISRLKSLTKVKIWLVCVLSILPLYLFGAIYQTAILTLVNGIELQPALITLLPLIVLYLIDAVTCGALAVIYPRIKGGKKSKVIAQ